MWYNPVMGLSETSKHYVNDFKIYLEVERNFSKHTIRAYESDILAYLIWLDNIPAESANHAKIKEYRESERIRVTEEKRPDLLGR